MPIQQFDLGHTRLDLDPFWLDLDPDLDPFRRNLNPDLDPFRRDLNPDLGLPWLDFLTH